MQIEIDLSTTTETLSGVDVAAMCGITCSGGLPSIVQDTNPVRFDFPGVVSLTAEQQSALRVVAEYIVTGKERYPGLIACMQSAGGLQAGKRLFLKQQIDAPDAGSPIQSMLQLVVALSAGVENVASANTQAKQLIDQGAAD